MSTYELTPCPICGGRECTELAGRDQIRSDVERLWAFHERRLRGDTPPASLADRVVFSQHPPLRLVQCDRCAHVYRNPWERRESLASAYRSDAPSDEILRALLETQRVTFSAQARRLRRFVGAAGRGLEVGSYVGGFLAAARDVGWAFEGVDLSQRVVRFAAGAGFDVIHSEIEQVGGSKRYDAITIWNTFEQLYDSHAVLAAVRRLLKPRGVFVVRVPNGRFYVRWRARLRGPLATIAERLLVHNNLLSFPYRQAFSDSSMHRLLADNGLAIEHVFGDTLVPIADQWTTQIGAVEERVVKRLERLTQRGWRAPWVEVYARQSP
ncbi:MAG TPA: class I SAM-dependent methyltransferase [Gemmatimonadaceae bacterium]|nr:class I SAM-dependent methyltransferase [Gemmatimonadaceae bacterium]